MKRERNSGIEVLRIISMLLIIAYHFAVHGLVNTGFFDNNNNYVINAFAIGGKLGVSVFVLISGYFSTGHKLNYRRLATLEFEVLFYSIGLYLVSLLTDLEISRSDLKVLFPVIFSEYWFITDYLILMLLSPFLNAAICNTEKKSLKNIILLSICIWSLLPCLLRENTTYSDLIWFIVLYILAAYLKKYGGWRRISPRMLLLCSIGTFFLILCFSEITLWYGMRIDSQKLRAISGYYGNLNSPLVLLCSVTTLLYVLSRKEFSCTIINKVSEACFGGKRLTIGALSPSQTL